MMDAQALYERMKKVQEAKGYYFNSDREQSDILVLDAGLHFMGKDRGRSEWGFKWKRVDETMGQPEKEILTGWDLLADLKVPDINEKLRFAEVEKEKKKYGAENGDWFSPQGVDAAVARIPPRARPG